MLTVRRKALEPDIAVLELEGTLVMGPESKDVEAQIGQVLAAGSRKIILDLGAMSHLDSAGVGVIVKCFGQVKKAGGELRLARPQKIVAKIFQLTHVDKVIRMTETLEAAAENFSV